MNFLDTCSKRHSRKERTPSGCNVWRRGEDEAFGIIVMRNGRPQIKARCRSCGTLSGALPHNLIVLWGLKLSDFTWEQVNSPANYDPCSVYGCQADGVEYHHFAPRNTFGLEAEDWPVMPLCREHHTEWHKRMNGYLWNRRSIA